MIPASEALQKIGRPPFGIARVPIVEAAMNVEMIVGDSHARLGMSDTVA